MSAISRLRTLYRNLLHRPRVERDLDDEIRGMFEMLVEEKMTRGMPRSDARRAAAIEMGRVESIKDRVRDVRAGALWDAFVQDVRYGVRVLRSNPLFTLTATLSLAAGIGANTAIFSLVNVLIVRELRVASPEQLIEVGRITQYGRSGSFSYPIYERLRDQTRNFDGVLAMSRMTVEATVDDVALQPAGRFVSGNFFETLGVPSFVGRVLSPNDDRLDSTDGTAVAIISHGSWVRHFGRNPSVVGKRLTVDAVPFTIVGVLPETFEGLVPGRPTDFYVPLASERLLRKPSWLGRGDFNWLAIVGRLKPGTALEAADVDLGSVFSRFLEDYASTMTDPIERQTFRSHRVVADSASGGLTDLRRQFSRPVLLLMAAVALVLLIACVNVVNLLLARGIARRREIALRLAIGASRGRLIRQLLTESSLLGIVAGALGLLLASRATPLLVGLLSQGAVRLDLDVAPDWRVLFFTASVALGSSLVAGVLPAARAARMEIAPSFHGDSRTGTTTRASVRWNRVLIAGQVALSLVLLVGASLLIATLRNIRGFDPGFNRAHVLLLNMNPAKAGYKDERLAQYYRDVLDRVRAAPGVRAASLSIITPISGGGIDLPMIAGGQPRAMVYVNRISDGYFATMGTPLLLGRDFDARDGDDASPVAIVNLALARRFFKTDDPIGQRVSLGGRDGIQIVGVVANAKYLSLRESDVPTIYVYGLDDGVALSVRTSGDPLVSAHAIRNEVLSVAPAVPVGVARTLADQVERSLVIERLIARLLGAFAVLALLLASVGLYGVLGYSVIRRTAEIGVRLALGATRGAVLWSVLRESWILVAIGAVIGLAAAMALTRFLSGLLYGVTPTDPGVLALAIACLFFVALGAAAGPAWRASRVDPLRALRHE